MTDTLTLAKLLAASALVRGIAPRLTVAVSAMFPAGEAMRVSLGGDLGDWLCLAPADMREVERRSLKNAPYYTGTGFGAVGDSLLGASVIDLDAPANEERRKAFCLAFAALLQSRPAPGSENETAA